MGSIPDVRILYL